MLQYIIFGAGQYALKAIDLLGKENIKMILDNNPQIQGGGIKGITIYDPNDQKEILNKYQIVVSVSQKYQNEIIEQLRKLEAKDILTIQELQTEMTRRKIEARTNYIDIYNNTLMWIRNNTLACGAIICNTDNRKGYPEVTGYFIPTLLKWGEKELAFSYAKWLCDIQRADGSWYDVGNKSPYVFDTAQVLKGLISIRTIYPQVDKHIVKGCDWIISNMQESGRLTTPSKDAWGNGRECSELVHLYCLSPLVQAADILNKPHYREAAYKSLNYYKNNHYDEIMNFGLLSHFYAYVMEALLDMGEFGMASEAMEKIAKLQKDNGAVPAYNNVDYVCSTGLFQLALVWFRLGNIERGNKAFIYACKLQNKSGGWYGSYLSETNPHEDNDYFPNSEISWAAKYFLDALYYKNIAEFNLLADSFLDTIEKEDGRYCVIRDTISEEQRQKGHKLRILDVGCGKGRYLKNLLEDEPQNKYYAVDMSQKVMEYIIAAQIEKKQGTLTYIEYPDDYFDIVYTCEALEHAIDISNAIREMACVTKNGGKIVVIDKNKDELGRMEIGEWEVWFEEDVLKDMMSEYCSEVKVIKRIDYEKKKDDNLFLAWIGTVSKGK